MKKNAMTDKAENRPPAAQSAAQSAAPAGARGRILDRLKRDGPQSSAALGAALGVTPMAARLQLYELENEGLVRCVESLADGRRGRPSKLWSLTGEAERVFPDAHQGLAVGMIGAVERLFGADGLSKVVADHAARQRQAYANRLAGATTLAEKLQRLARIRSDEGYMAEVRRDGGGYLFIENHCPICSAAKACMRFCASELDVFQSVLGDKITVTREEHILMGARRCAYKMSGE